ncbi:hypothetical protein Tco_1301434, partial [Tanacetum coccineum]
MLGIILTEVNFCQGITNSTNGVSTASTYLVLPELVNTARRKINTADAVCDIFIVGTVPLLNTSRVLKCRFRIHFDIQYSSTIVILDSSKDILKKNSIFTKEEEMAPLALSAPKVTLVDLKPEVNEYGPRDSSLKHTTGCDKESDNSKENTDDSLKQQRKTDSKISSVKSPLKVDKDWKEKFFYPANHVREEEPKKARENNDAPIIEDWVSDDEDEVEPIPKVEKKTVIPTATKKEFVKPEKPVRRSVRYAEMYRSQRPRGNQRNWNGQKSNQLGCNFVFNNKACFICGSFDHIQYSCPKTSHPSAHKHMAPKAVLMKTGLKSVNTARPVNTVRSVNTGRPFSTARSFNTVRPSYTAHPKSIVHCARPRTYFQNQAQSTIHRPFYKRTALTKRSYYQKFNTGRQNVNTVRARGFNVVKPSACWVWKPIKPNGASLSNSQLNDKGFVDSGCSKHMSGNIAHLSNFKDFDGGYVTFELKFNLFSVSTFGGEEDNIEDVVVVANDLCSSMIQTTPKFLIKMSPKRSEGEESEYLFFEGDGSSSDEWGYYGVAGNDYEGPPVFDDDQYEEESMPLYDTDIEDVIEEEEGFIGKGTFGGEEDNIEDVVVVANDLCSSM